MIEQIFDFCGLYPLARAIRSWNKTVFDLGEPWMEAYRAEEHKGHELLQRRKRLENRRTEILSAPIRNQQTQLKYCDEEHSGKLPDELYDIDEQLLDVGRRYHTHRLKIERLWVTGKDDPWFRDVVMSLKPQYAFITKNDKTYFWLQKRRICAATGGCCGRECGCCEKPLGSLGSVSFLGLNKREIGLYVHCTAECGCCIKRNGGYQPIPSVAEVTVRQ